MVTQACQWRWRLLKPSMKLIYICKLMLLLLCSAVVGSVHLAAQEVLSERITEYHIDVTLDPLKKKLHGSQIVTWNHPGTEPVDALYFHLYPNAFESKHTSFMKESGGKLRDDTMQQDRFGHMVITDIRTSDGENLFAHMQFVQPDDGNKHDKTLMKLRLPESILPGEEIVLHMSFEVQLPFAFARMGYVDDFVMAGQWFPKLAVYEREGVRGRAQEGFNAHQYHGNSEFYADFGIYNVRITVPKDYIVAATGFPIKKSELIGENKTFYFYADDVHDFAWAASADFVYVEQAFSTEHLPGVKIKLYLDPKHEHLKERYLFAAKRSLARYSQWYGSYPYSTLSIVVPPEGGNGAGGMEYPTLITAWAADKSDPGFELERVLVHEIGHQYWYGMVASNEFEEAWLDEAFTSYSEDRLMRKEYGLASNRAMEGSYMTSPDSLVKFSWHYGSHDQYAENVYIRGKLVLEDIEQKIGPEMMNRLLKTYFQLWKFKHPSTEDFKNVLERITDKNWDDYFEQFVYGSLMIDYAVEAIQMELQEVDGNQVYENKVLLLKNGGRMDPVPLLFQFTDGLKLLKNWNGAEEQIQFRIVHDAPLDWVMIDPEHTMILENKHINNFLRAHVENQVKVRWSLGAVKLIEAVIGLILW